MTLLFHEQIYLPFFAAFPMVKEAEGREILRNYYRTDHPHAGKSSRKKKGHRARGPGSLAAVFYRGFSR